MNKFHKCIYALINVLTKRMSLFYKNELQSPEDLKETEKKFRSVVVKITNKLKEVEHQSQTNFGPEKTSQMFKPLTQSLRPMLQMLGIQMVQLDDPLQALIKNSENLDF